MRVLVIGGTGFIGRHLLAHLVEQGHDVSVPTRRYAKGRDLLLLPTVTLLDCDIHNDEHLHHAISQNEVVVNLVGILHGQRGDPYGADFDQLHVQLPRRIARACRHYGIRRLLHVSALGADNTAPSSYLRSKAAGEAAIVDEYRDYSHGSYTLFRPSVVFGDDDNFMNLFARLARWFPVLLIASAHARMQPVYVGDVAKAMVNALGTPRTRAQTYDLVGPSVYTLGELVKLAALWSGHPRKVISVPYGLGVLQAALLSLLPGEPLLSRDNLDSLKVDSVSDAPLAPELGLFATPLESVAPRYLRKL